MGVAGKCLCYRCLKVAGLWVHVAFAAPRSQGAGCFSCEACGVFPQANKTRVFDADVIVIVIVNVKING